VHSSRSASFLQYHTYPHHHRSYYHLAHSKNIQRQCCLGIDEGLLVCHAYAAKDISYKSSSYSRDCFIPGSFPLVPARNVNSYIESSWTHLVALISSIYWFILMVDKDAAGLVQTCTPVPLPAATLHFQIVLLQKYTY
jgi:hypothetical protein